MLIHDVLKKAAEDIASGPPKKDAPGAPTSKRVSLAVSSWADTLDLRAYHLSLIHDGDGALYKFLVNNHASLADDKALTVMMPTREDLERSGPALEQDRVFMMHQARTLKSFSESSKPHLLIHGHIFGAVIREESLAAMIQYFFAQRKTITVIHGNQDSSIDKLIQQMDVLESLNMKIQILPAETLLDRVAVKDGFPNLSRLYARAKMFKPDLFLNPLAAQKRILGMA